MRAIAVERLLSLAVRFYLGKQTVNGIDEPVPLYLERDGGGWVVRAQMGGMNPWYLNEAEPFWRYKVGMAFRSKEAALAQLNAVEAK